MACVAAAAAAACVAAWSAAGAVGADAMADGAASTGGSDITTVGAVLLNAIVKSMYGSQQPCIIS